ncbi:MAG: hypothetical protein ACLUNQ_01550 [Oscillospiraceae bacterium]
MMVGLQGAGKTTNGAKLAGLMRQQLGQAAPAGGLRRVPSRRHQAVAGGGQTAGLPVFEMGQIDPVDIAKDAIAPRQATTATTWSSWTPPAGSTSTRR